MRFDPRYIAIRWQNTAGIVLVMNDEQDLLMNTDMLINSFAFAKEVKNELSNIHTSMKFIRQKPRKRIDICKQS